MDLQLTVPGLLFPAISLLYLSYNGRFLALSQLIRSLHARWHEDGDETIYGQIQNLRVRLKLIRWMQICGATSFILAASSMTGLFYGYTQLGQMLFGGSLVMLILSVAYLLRENIISVHALELQLGSLPRLAEKEPS
ncbi:MAG: DUF2721 domain-containing protein [Myxococcota bacterium]